MSDWSTLSKKELWELLESYDDEKHIVFKVNLKQGVVGFWDVKKDEINSDTDKLVLMSPALDKWYAEDIQELVEENKELKNENEELKATLRTYRKVANCRNCDYHNYDWRSDGDEFEICEKGNDVTEGICEEWREL